MGGQVQIHPVALDVSAAVLRRGNAVDVGAVAGHDEHPGAIGDEPGIHRGGAPVDTGTGGGDGVAAPVGMGVGGGPDGVRPGIGQYLAGGKGNASVGDDGLFGDGRGGAGAYGDNLGNRLPGDGFRKHLTAGLLTA